MGWWGYFEHKERVPHLRRLEREININVKKSDPWFFGVHVWGPNFQNEEYKSAAEN